MHRSRKSSSDSLVESQLVQRNPGQHKSPQESHKQDHKFPLGQTVKACAMFQIIFISLNVSK